MSLLCLSDAILPINVDEFASTMFGRTPQLCGRRQLESETQFGLEHFEELLWQHEQVLSTQLAVYGLTGGITVPRRHQNKDLFTWSIDQHLAGNNLRLEDVHKMLPWAASLAGDTAKRLLSRVTVDVVFMSNMMVANLNGLTNHQLDFLIIQTSGVSNWEFNAATSANLESSNIGGLVNLKPGEAMYLPCGLLRSAKSGSDYSLSVILKIKPLTAADFLEALVEVATEDDSQMRFSVASAEPVMAERYRLGLARLAAHSSSSEANRRAWEHLQIRIADEYRPIPGGRLIAAHQYMDLTRESLVRVRYGSIVAIAELENGVYLFVQGLGGVSERDSKPGGIMFPHKAASLLRAVFDQTAPFAASDLPEQFTDQTRLATVKRLVREGALEIVDAYRGVREQKADVNVG